MAHIYWGLVCGGQKEGAKALGSEAATASWPALRPALASRSGQKFFSIIPNMPTTVFAIVITITRTNIMITIRTTIYWVAWHCATKLRTMREPKTVGMCTFGAHTVSRIEQR